MARMSAHICFACRKPIVTSARVIGDVEGRNQHFHRVCWRTYGQIEPEIIAPDEPTQDPELTPEDGGVESEAVEETPDTVTPTPSLVVPNRKPTAQKTPAAGKPANRGKR
jgi:hypothetical protein